MLITASVATVAAVTTGLFGLIGLVSSTSHEEGYNEGYKDGWSDASKVYEEKFIKLRDEALKAQGIISEQKRLLKEAYELMLEMQEYGVDEPEVAQTYAKTKDFVRNLLKQGIRAA